MQVNERIWIINHLLDILMGSIAEYFNKPAGLVKIHFNFDYDNLFCNKCSNSRTLIGQF